MKIAEANSHGTKTTSYPKDVVLTHTERERRATYTVRLNKAKPEQIILSKTYPTKVVINSQLLDM
jgi:hypothetical protein